MMTSTGTTPCVAGLVLSRKGSQRLPGKALLPLQGRALATYTFEAASDASQLATSWLFTDDEALPPLAVPYRVHCPAFSRPSEVSGAAATSLATIQYFLRHLPVAEHPEWLMLLQVTSPLRTAADIDGAIRLLRTMPAADGVLSTCVAADDAAGLARPWVSVALSSTITPNGALYLLPTATWLALDPARPLLAQGLRLVPYYMPPARSVDVDTAEDLALAAHWLAGQGAVSLKQAAVEVP